jgi:hypothetical protein
MQRWTIRAATLGALSAAALIGASVGAPAGPAAANRVAVDGFSGPLAPHVVARPIDREAATATRDTLHRVPCAAASAARSCFAAGR